jgi:glycosyltransferase involved in cell wall biosynthesis
MNDANIDNRRETTAEIELVIVTSCFPYGGSEGFLEPELQVLSQKFRRIYLQPTRGGGRRRPVPRNVVVLDPISERPTLGYYVWFGFLPKTLLRICRELSKQKFPIVKTIPITIQTFKFFANMAALERSSLMSLFRHGARVVFYAYWSDVSASLVPQLARRGYASCVRYHGSDLYLEANERAPIFPMREEIVRNTALSVFVSEHGSNYFQEHWGRATPSGARIAVSRLGTEEPLGVFPRGPFGPRLRILSCSYIVPLKRVDAIAKVLGALAGHREIEWFHIGDGTRFVLEKAMNSTPANLRLNHLGSLTRREIFEFYKKQYIDIFINLSTSEGLPVSMMEAISHDIPVVATRVGGVHEIIVPGVSGLLVESTDPLDHAKIALEIEEQLDDGGLLTTCRPRKYWQANFRAQHNFSEFAGQLSRVHE